MAQRKRLFRIVFCGKGHFVSSFEYTKDYFRSEPFHLIIEQCSYDNLEERLKDADVVIPFMGKITESVISRARNLKLIMQFGTGLEGVDIPAATRAGIKVAKIPSNQCDNASSCAEHILYLTLALMRNQSGMIHSLQNGNIGVPTGKTISGSMFLIYGYGGIGSQLNSKLLSLGASTRIISRTANVNEFNHIHATKENSSSLERCQMGSPERLSEYLAMSDVVALCTTQNQHTVGLVNKSFLSQMKKGSYLVNVTRVPPPPLLLPGSPSSYPPRMFSQGGLISYPDLYQALLDSHLGGVGLDVYHTEPFPLLSDPQTQVTDPLLTHPNVIVTPHIAGVTEQSYRGMAKILGDNIKALINGEEVKHCVN